MLVFRTFSRSSRGVGGAGINQLDNVYEHMCVDPHVDPHPDRCHPSGKEGSRGSALRISIGIFFSPFFVV